MQWEAWVQGCREKNPTVDPRKWLEATIDQNVIMREESVRGMGDLLSGKSVPLDDFTTPEYTSSQSKIEQVIDQITALEGRLEVGKIYMGDDALRWRALIFGRLIGVGVAQGEAPDAGRAICLAAIEFVSNTTGVELDMWIKDVLEKGE